MSKLTTAQQIRLDELETELAKFHRLAQLAAQMGYHKKVVGKSLTVKAEMEDSVYRLSEVLGRMMKEGDIRWDRIKNNEVINECLFKNR